MARRLLIHSQSITGIGHRVRTALLAEGLAREFEVLVVDGSEPVAGFEVPEGVEWLDLPVVRTDAGLVELESADPGRSLEDTMALRRDQLLELADSWRPDALITELYPFGRRRFACELLPLIERVRADGGRVFSSVRDLLVGPAKIEAGEEYICQTMNEYFDGLLVHGDPALHRLEESFSRTADLACEIRYTGYVTPPREPGAATRANPPEIVVSVGGGRLGQDLLDAIPATAALLAERIPHRIRLFAGPLAPPERLQALRQASATQANLDVEHFTSDLPAILRRADLSISLGGYNTVLGVLASGTRSLVLPYERANDREQVIRCDRLAAMGRVGRLRSEDLAPDRLAARICDALEQPVPELEIDTDGVSRSVRQIAHWLEEAVVS